MAHSWRLYSICEQEKTWVCKNCKTYLDRPSGFPKPSNGMRVNKWVVTGTDKTFTCEEAQILGVTEE